MADNPITILHRLRASSGPKETVGLSDDVIEDFRVADHDKIGIRDFMDYSLAQIDNDLRISTGIGNTILYGVDQSSFDAATLIVDV